MKKALFITILVLLSAAIVSAANINVVMKTSLGDIVLELYPDDAPITVENFLTYVQEGFYDGLIFHRVIPGFMIQGGAFDSLLNQMEAHDPIVNESYNGLKNLRGTIAMARQTEPDTATSQFFINHVDNPFLDLGDENAVSEDGYCVFGRVIKGMDAVDAIAAVDTETVGSMDDVPAFDIMIDAVAIQTDFNFDLDINVQDLAVMADNWLLAESSEQIKLTADDGSAADEFGKAVAVDGNYAIVGAPKENDNGVIYIYKYDGTEWIQQFQVPSPSSNTGDNFGQSVSISGNFAVIGAPYYDANAENDGAVFILTRTVDPNTPWSQHAMITSDDQTEGMLFGYSVDVDNGILAIGAIGDNVDGDQSGAVYVYEGKTSGWEFLSKLSAGSDGQSNDWLGYSVAVDDRVIAAGAVNDDDPNTDSTDSGAVYVFGENTEDEVTYWEKKAKLTASDAATEDWFGYSVDIEGNNIIVGATGDDDEGLKSGSVYIFENTPAEDTDPNWIQTQKFTASDAAPFDRFGCAVAMNNSLAVIGARYDDDNGTNSGSAYVFAKDQADWFEYEKITGIAGQSYDYLGHAVSMSDYYIILGAYGDDDKGAASGSAEIMNICPAADLNDDCAVDLLDVAIIAEYWLL
ncbi:MAG: peptidylprolyl isomerase [Sedimentisphaerales bacterium]|nr:peptidylprolyl isomerase [Sedimentisphaerales bacterium]